MPASHEEPSTPEIVEVPERERFEMPVDGDVAILTRERHGNRLVLVHTEVPPAYRGKGAASRLVRGVLDQARAEGAVVVPICPFVKAFLRKHPEYQALTSRQA